MPKLVGAMAELCHDVRVLVEDDIAQIIVTKDGLDRLLGELTSLKAAWREDRPLGKIEVPCLQINGAGCPRAQLSIKDCEAMGACRAPWSHES